MNAFDIIWRESPESKGTFQVSRTLQRTLQFYSLFNDAGASQHGDRDRYL